MRMLVAAAAGCLMIAGCSSSGGGSGSSAATAEPLPAPTTTSAGTPVPGSSSATATGVPRFAHIVVVIEENHAESEIIGDSRAPFMNTLAGSGAVLTASYAITHPSEPNYVALFSGSTHGLGDDSCPHTYSGDNLGAQLRSAGHTFTGYSDSLPSVGYTGCTSGAYARKHVPWADFADLPGSASQPMTAFPSDFTKLPDLAFIIPNLDHDMHDGTVQQADSWLRDHLGGYARWAATHDSLLVVTWDEDDKSANNRIPGIMVGAHVKPGAYGGHIDHYSMLRTLEASFGLPALGTAADRAPIAAVWTS